MAIVIYKEKQSDGKKLQVVSREKALAYQHNLRLVARHPEKFDETATSELEGIASVYLGKPPIQTRDSNGNFPKTASDFEPPVQMGQQQLTHEGIEQGMSQAMPTGDRD